MRIGANEGANFDRLREAVGAAAHLRDDSGRLLPEYSAAVSLAMTLAARVDALEASGWVREDGKSDTTTAGQYLRALEALGLTPPRQRAAKAQAPAKARPGRGSIADFRARGIRVVGE